MSDLETLDRRVDEAEGEGLRARWEFGVVALRDEVNLDKWAREHGKSPAEYHHRRRFARRFPTEEDFLNAVKDFGSWHAIVNKALGREPKEPIEIPPLPEGKYRTIVADPPWEVTAGAHEWGGSAASQALEYPTLTVPEIKALEIETCTADDAHLYLWTINAYVEDAYDVARAWGFKPSTLLVWCKPRHGLGLGGAYVLTTEYVLFARRGSLAEQQRVDTSWWEWPRGRHSEKPDSFYGIVASVSPGPYLELFARKARASWTIWGDEVSDVAA